MKKPARPSAARRVQQAKQNQDPLIRLYGMQGAVALLLAVLHLFGEPVFWVAAAILFLLAVYAIIKRQRQLNAQEGEETNA